MALSAWNREVGKPYNREEIGKIAEVTMKALNDPNSNFDIDQALCAAFDTSELKMKNRLEKNKGCWPLFIPRR